MNEKKSVLKWIKRHRKQLIAAGLSIAAIVAIILGIKNRTALMEAWESLKAIVVKSNPAGAKITEAVTITTQVTSPIVHNSHTAIRSAAEVVKTPFDVQQHLRSLPQGWHPSAEKIAAAADHGFTLLPGQTWVENYTKGLAA